MSKAIQLCKSGVVIREYPCEYYTMNLINGMPAILEKEGRTIVCVPSPNVYDFIEINETGSGEGESNG